MYQPMLRKGKWTVEEENYANKIIDLFNKGKLRIHQGTTLRSYLSDKLRCDPMRITKKYAGTSSIGKQIYSPCEEFHSIAEEIRRGEDELARLEQLFLTRISNKGSFVEDEPEVTEPLRRNAPRNCSKTDLTALLQEDQDSSQKLRGKRVRSAPDLSELYTRFPSSRSRDNNNGRESHLDNAPEGTEGRQLQGRKRLLSPPPHTMSTGTSSRSSNAGEGPVPRRAHSVMALMDFERLVDDEHAASELFLEFVTQMGQRKRPGTGEIPVDGAAQLAKALADEGSNALMQGVCVPWQALDVLEKVHHQQEGGYQQDGEKEEDDAPLDTIGYCSEVTQNVQNDLLRASALSTSHIQSHVECLRIHGDIVINNKEADSNNMVSPGLMVVQSPAQTDIEFLADSELFF